MSNTQPKAARVMRGFVLDQCALTIHVAFASDGSLWIKQGKDGILISANAVEAFKRGMTWVNPAVICAN